MSILVSHNIFSRQEVEIKKEVAPKAEEEGAESSSSEANGPVTGVEGTSSSTADVGAGASEAGRW